MSEQNQTPGITAEDAPVERDPQADLRQLESLATLLAAERQKCIEHRETSGIDMRWFQDVEAYEGRDEVTRNYAGLRALVEGYVESQQAQTKKRSTLVVNVTRQKVNTAAARRADIAFPTDDRNWDLNPSTVPELVEQLEHKHVGLTRNGKAVMVFDPNDKDPQTGQPKQRQATMADFAQMNMDESKKRAQGMRDEIDDQLDYSAGGCGWEGIGRQIIFDNALLGVGVVKGPIISSTTKKVWIPVAQGSPVHKLTRVKDKKPVSKRIDPWDIYPHFDCGENPKSRPIWERSKITGADIRQMADLGGYITANLEKVLLEGPTKSTETTRKPGTTEATVTAETIFEQWERHGELDRDDLLAAGVQLPDDDIFRSYAGVIIMINDTLVKADIELLDTEEVPYDFYVVNPASGSWCGYSESFLARSAQRAITAAWRTMMDNAGQFVGAQIVIDRKSIEPADGKWELSGMKVWWMKGDNGDVGKAFALHEIPAHQTEYANIIKMGMEFLDQETAIPQLAQGEQGEATDVLGGMNLLLNASNTVQRRALKAFDDQVTIPHIRRYVDWNMQYSQKAEIKGDFEVQARASGALLEQDIQNRGAASLLALAKDPAFAAGMKKWDALRRVVRALRFNPADFVETDDQIKANEERQAQNQQQDPRIEVEKLRIEFGKLELEVKQAMGDKDRESKVAIAMINAKLASEELSSVERQVLEKLKTELTQTGMKLNVMKDLATADHIADLHKHHNPKPALPRPPVEVPGRAQRGRAYEA